MGDKDKEASLVDGDKWDLFVNYINYLSIFEFAQKSLFKAVKIRKNATV